MNQENEELSENGLNYDLERKLIDSRDAGRNEGEPDYDTNTSSTNDSLVVQRQSRMMGSRQLIGLVARATWAKYWRMPQFLPPSQMIRS